MKNNHLLLVGSDFQSKKGTGDKNFWLDLTLLLAPAFFKITVLSLTKTPLTYEEFNVGNCKIIIKFISPIFLDTPEGDSKRIFWKEGAYPSYLGIIEKFLTFRKLKKEIVDFKRHSPFTHIHLMDNFGFTNRLISQCVDTPVTVSAIAYQGNSPSFIYDNYLRISYNAPNLKVVAHNDILRKKLMAIGVGPENIVTIPWGVFPGEQLKEGLIDKQSLKETFSIPIDQPLILWSGYIQQIKRKDFLFAYNLAKEVKKRGYKGTFFFAFKPESFENKFYKIADEAKQLGIIIKVTTKEEFDNLTNSADVFFSPILNNRCIVAPPLTWIEMLNKGIPVVTTSVQGTENIIVNGETGFLFGSLEGLVNSLTDIAEKPNSYSARCKDFVKRRFNVKQCAEAYIELFTNGR
jgi:glycosyltransferase involved in cell wall biosynthesis